jgi:4'-phosphopantetheinyl transferase EntD
MTATKRATYGFALNFPQTFTMRQLRNLKGRKIQYITLYMRVKKALKDGEIVVVGKQEPNRTRKGRKELIYARANAKTAVANVGASKDAVAMLS